MDTRMRVHPKLTALLSIRSVQGSAQSGTLSLVDLTPHQVFRIVWWDSHKL
jgi:hypothetical protein